MDLFRDKAKTKATSSRIENTLESGGRARKKGRLKQEEAKVENRSIVVRRIRSAVTGLLTQGIRAHMFHCLLFLVEKIESFAFVEDARQAGYEIKFEQFSDDELMTGGSVGGSTALGTIWDISNAHTVPSGLHGEYNGAVIAAEVNEKNETHVE